MYKTINSRFLKVFVNNPTAREIVMYGGSGSGKTTSILQYLLKRFIDPDEPPMRILIARKWLSSLKNTALIDAVNILSDWGFYDSIYHNKSDNFMTLNGSRIDFSGLDDPEKQKGSNFGVIWLEEATDFNLEDMRQLRLRLGRKKDTQNALYIFSFNPINPYHWTWTDLVQTPQENRIVMHSTYKDNLQNLSETWIRDLESLKDQDMNYYSIYALGKIGQISNLIFPNWQIAPMVPPQYQTTSAGLDFGYNNPTSLVNVIQKPDGSFILDERLYQTKMTNDDLIEWLKSNHKLNIPIYADSAEPARIEEIKRAGFTIFGAKKNVKDGLDFMKSSGFSVTPGSANLIKELQGYKYRENREGHIFDEPVKFNDHLIDSSRYSIYSHYSVGGKFSIPDELAFF